MYCGVLNLVQIILKPSLTFIPITTNIHFWAGEKFWKFWYHKNIHIWKHENMPSYTTGNPNKPARNHAKSIYDIDIHERSQTSYTAKCNGVISHGVQIEGLWVFTDHTCKNKHKTNASTIFARRAAFYACLSLHSDGSRCRWHTHLTKRRYFDYRKNPKTPNLSPCQNQDGAGFGISIYIYDLCINKNKISQ